MRRSKGDALELFVERILHLFYEASKLCRPEEFFGYWFCHLAEYQGAILHDFFHVL